MTISEMHTAFKLELDKTSSLELPAYEPEEIDFWLNNAIRKFVKTRYSGVNLKQESFEQSQKRIDDLRTLVRYKENQMWNDTTGVYSISTSRPNTYIFDLDDLTSNNSDVYWFTLSEEVEIGFLSLEDDTTTLYTGGQAVTGETYKVVLGNLTNTSHTWRVGNFYNNIGAQGAYGAVGRLIKARSSVEPVKEATANTYTMLLQNPYSEHHLHYEKASPIRLFLGNTVELITDGNYQPMSYNIRYLCKPATVDGVSLVTVDCDLPEHTHDEVVRLAANMALENIEQPRYQSQSNEVATME